MARLDREAGVLVGERVQWARWCRHRAAVVGAAVVVDAPALAPAVVREQLRAERDVLKISDKKYGAMTVGGNYAKHLLGMWANRLGKTDITVEEVAQEAILKAMADNPQSPPPGLRWDLFLGPANVRPYNPAYHPGRWRAWLDFGTGALGDMACHILGTPNMAMRLSNPASVECVESTPPLPCTIAV